MERASSDKEGEAASGKRLRRTWESRVSFNWIQTYAPATDARIQLFTDATVSTGELGDTCWDMGEAAV